MLTITKRQKSRILLIASVMAIGLTGCNNKTPGNKPPADTPSVSPILTKAVTITPVPGTPTAAPTSTPTPTNTPIPTPAGTSGEVRFSEVEAFLSNDTSLRLEITSKKDGFITYTMDGTEPSDSSSIYEQPLFLSASEVEEPSVYTIRAKAFYEDGSCSPTYVHTYFVGTNVTNRFTTLVFSINADPAVLTDSPDGILYGENYKQRGDASEREIHLESFTSSGELLFNQFAGARVYGGTSREHAVKSLKLYARKSYEEGKGTFAFSEFGAMTADGTEPVKKYDKLVLRNGGDDFQLGFLRDELFQRLAKKTGFEIHENVLPAVAYVNGNYYGYYWLHESYCNKYFQNRYGKSEGEFVVLEGSDARLGYGDDAVEKAAAKEYNEFCSKMVKKDLSKDENYQELISKIDIESYLDYMSYNMYLANYDWPLGNFRCFRYVAADGEAYSEGIRDGRYRFLLHDMDCGFGTYQSTSDAGAKRNDLTEVLSPSGRRYDSFLAAVLKRDECKQYFIDRMLYYMSGPLSFDSVDEMLTKVCAERDSELSIYIKYLRSLPSDAEIYTSEATVEKHMARIRSFAEQRPAYMIKYLEDFFQVSLIQE